MGIFTRKDYTDDFETIHKELKDLKNEVNNGISRESDKNVIKQQEIEKSIDILIKGFNQMTSYIKEIQTMLVNITDEMEDMAHVSMTFGSTDEEPYEPKEKGSTKPQKGAHISKHKRYPQFKTPRYYDMDLAKFYSKGGNGAKKYFDLNFRQLVSIIKGIQNGLNVKELMINPILADFTYANLLNYTYIWRAGGFNNAIEEVARELGFNPKKLISHECD